MFPRSSGILLHITSLPSHHGIGDLGPGAYTFIDFLAESGQTYWQILPLTPTNPILGNSPYSSHSAFAGNPLLISPTVLVEETLVVEEEVSKPQTLHPQQVNYPAVQSYKERIFQKAFQRSFQRVEKSKEYQSFIKANKGWLEDYALYMGLKEKFNGQPWNEWPTEIAGRRPEALDQRRGELKEKMDYEKFIQFLFDRQWRALHAYAQKKGVHIIGDMPIYVNYDSVDVWSHPDLFKLDDNLEMTHVAGVPPDYFSENGQLWGNPLYEWKMHQVKKFDWWKERFRRNFDLVDVLRVDHFRGFVGYWQVKNGATTAKKGEWVEAPAELFFDEMLKSFKDFPIIAEDLGVITDEVKAIVKKYRFPGMKVMLFSFDGDPQRNPYTMENHIENCILYTGTHDNNTARGWLEHDASDEEKAQVDRVLGQNISVDEMAPQLLKLCMSSVANMVIVPLQDVLGLGQEARMNRPSTSRGNWEWRVLSEQLSSETAHYLLDMTKKFDR